jgi:enoyl-CoA hydratase/carnithine racemase
MSERDGLVRTDEDNVCTLKICRGKSLNAINRQLLRDLSQELESIALAPTIRALIITAEGETAFCAGADLKERKGMTLDETREFVTTIGPVFRQLELVPIPTIAVMNGVAFGGGLELALACDFRIAVASARMGLTECQLGIIPGAGGTQRLPRLIGPSKAAEMILTAKVVDAYMAVELGLINYVEHSVNSALDRAYDIISGIKKCAPLSVRAAKSAMQKGADMSMDDALKEEFRNYETLIESEDRVEGLRAFAEKRRPQFMGR